MALASLEQLLANRGKRRFKGLTLPVSGFAVRIRSLTELELSGYQAAALSAKGGPGSLSKQRVMDAGRRLIVLCLVDAEGNRLLNDGHVEALADWDSADTAFLYEECAKHCGINREDIEDLAKNSSATIADV